MATVAAGSGGGGGGVGKLDAAATALLVCDVQERFRPIIAGFPAVVDTSRRMVRRVARRAARQHTCTLPMRGLAAPAPLRSHALALAPAHHLRACACACACVCVCGRGCVQLRAAAALQLPVIVTEQYPKALGSSVAELQECLPEGSPGARALARAGPLACGTCGEACPRCPPSFIIPTLAHTPPPTLNSPIQIPPTPPAVVAKTKFSMCTEEVDAALGALPGVRSVLIVGLETHVCVLQTSLDLIGVGFGGRGGGGGGAVVVGVGRGM